MTQTERVILIQGDANKWYDQAIFIVKPDGKAGNVPVDMVSEAEKIIHNYLVKNKRPLPKGLRAQGAPVGYAPASQTVNTTKKRKASRRMDFYLNIIMILACLAIAGIFMYGMFG
ncbi:MAG: hypothetical protein FWC16_11835 [Defluviitaleaceae bacterium]|nr:hypothetical protein [Defluviitaleaceae bacterium]MCL2275608.1 hypothetical protein [Defluviitaleaceae bacterium]